MDGEVVIQVDLDTKGFEEEIRQTENYLNRLINSYEKASKPSAGFEKNEEQLKKMRLEIEKTSNKLIDLRKRQDDLNKGELSRIPETIGTIGKSMENVTKKIGRWALSIFAVRSAYMFVRQAVSTLSSENEKINADIQNIRYAIASTLQPVIEGIIQLVYKLLSLINGVAYAFFGVNLFANANKKALQDSVGSAKELRKQLAGFDEMNVLGDNTQASGGAGGISNIQPQQIEVDTSWVDVILQNKDAILGLLGGIVTYLTLIKLGFDSITAFGIGLLVLGLVKAISNLIDFLNDPTFENFIGILEGIAIAVTGVAIAVGAWPVAVGAAIAFVVVELTKHFDFIMNMFDNLIAWLDKNVLGALRYLFGPLGDIIYLPISQAIRSARELFNSFYGGIKEIVNGIVKMFRGDFLGGIKSVFSGLSSVLLAPFKALWTGVKTILNFIIDGINVIISGLNSLSIDIPDWVPAVGGQTWGINIPKIPRLAKGTIMNVPGRGVPTPSGNAIWGEQGREAYLPLSDTQLLTELGSTIGKYININATVPVYVGNRQIAREIRKINADEEFASNR